VIGLFSLVAVSMVVPAVVNKMDPALLDVYPNNLLLYALHHYIAELNIVRYHEALKPERPLRNINKLKVMKKSSLDYKIWKRYQTNIFKSIFYNRSIFIFKLCMYVTSELGRQF
jgi:hypothetical protein